MSNLADLINKRDEEIAAHNAEIVELHSNASQFMNEIHSWIMQGRWRLEDYPEDNGKYHKPFSWLGMQFWPKLMDESHLNYVNGFLVLYMCTLNTAQAETLRSAWFGGRKEASVKNGRIIEWKFNYREDGWVELIIGRR